MIQLISYAVSQHLIQNTQAHIDKVFSDQLQVTELHFTPC